MFINFKCFFLVNLIQVFIKTREIEQDYLLNAKVIVILETKCIINFKNLKK